MTTPADPEFETLPRGYIRDKVILANFRNGLRDIINPETGQLFTEDEIARATGPGTRWYVEADSVDQLGQLDQRAAVYLSDQGRMERASTAYLEGPHADLWAPEGKLPATGGSGAVKVPAVAGTIILGSATIPDPAAYQARDGAGKKYQVFTTTVTSSSAEAEVTMVAIDTGRTTNLLTGDKLTWINRDPNMQPECTVAEDFSGGTNAETDAEFASRMQGTVRHKQGAGNDAQMRGWARNASNAIEDAFVYSCFLNPGTVLVAITQKRAGVKGPAARIPSPGTLAQLIAYLTPPGSAVVPARAFLVGVGVNGEVTDFQVRLSMPRGTVAGWKDVTPFPSYHATSPTITTVLSTSLFRITSPGDAALPGGATTLTGTDAPSLMLWDEENSEFVLLEVASIEDLGSSIFEVTLSSPSSAIELGARVSPGMARHAIVSDAIVEYFDELGPGNLFDVDTDPRGVRCVRFPYATEEKPYRAGAIVASRIIEALGGSASDATLAAMSLTEPSYPTNLVDGPNLLVPGKVAVFPL